MRDAPPAQLANYAHMYVSYDGVVKILVSDNCKTAVIRSGG